MRRNKESLTTPLCALRWHIPVEAVARACRTCTPELSAESLPTRFTLPQRVISLLLDSLLLYTHSSDHDVMGASESLACARAHELPRPNPKDNYYVLLSHLYTQNIGRDVHGLADFEYPTKPSTNKEARRPLPRPVAYTFPVACNTRARPSYMLDFSPLANATEFRASLRTRALRPFSFRVAAFGGSRSPFGFLPAAEAAAGAAGGQAATASNTGSRETDAKDSAGKVLLRRERWPYCLVDSAGGQRTGDAGAVVLTEPVGGVAAAKLVGEGTGKGEIDTERSSGAKDGSDADGSEEAGGGHGEAGGGWRHPVSTAVAISAATDEARLAERERERCLRFCLFLGFARRQVNQPAECTWSPAIDGLFVNPPRPTKVSSVVLCTNSRATLCSEDSSECIKRRRRGNVLPCVPPHSAMQLYLGKNERPETKAKPHLNPVSDLNPVSRPQQRRSWCCMEQCTNPGKNKCIQPHLRPPRFRFFVSLFRSSLTGIRGVDALSMSTEFGRLSAWKAMADEVELPVQGLDLVVHLGNEVIDRQAPSTYQYFALAAFSNLRWRVRDRRM